MELKELLKYLEEHKDSKELQAAVAKLFPAAVTLKDVQAFLKDDAEGAKFLQAERDKAVTKGIETFKEKTLPGLIAEAQKKNEPTEDQKRIAAIETQLAESRAETKRQGMRATALKTLTEKKLPTSLVDYVIADSEEATETRITTLGSLFNETVKGMVDEALKNAPKPDGGGGGNPPSTKNPWKKESLNLTEQGTLIKTNPALAKKLAAEAGVTLTV